MSSLARRRADAIALLALPAVARPGCAALPKFEAPKLSVVSMKMQSADIFSQRLLVRMRVFNPNARELPIKGITYRIEVNDAELGNGGTAAPFTVPAMGEAEFDMQITANLASALAQVPVAREFVGNARLPAGRRGRLSSGFLRRIPFDERGSVKLK